MLVGGIRLCKAIFKKAQQHKEIKKEIKLQTKLHTDELF